jgi:hypothetical protein
MKKFLKELAYAMLMLFGMLLASAVWEANIPWWAAAILVQPCFIVVVIGAKRGFPDGVWGIR